MISEVTVDDVAAALARGETVIDVRTAEEFSAGHIERAQFMPLFAVPLRHSELDRRRSVFVVCESGARAFQACQYLEGAGFTTYNMSGGMVAWRAASLPIVTGTN